MISLVQPYVCRTLTTVTTRSYIGPAARRGIHTNSSSTVRASFKPWLWGAALIASASIMCQQTIYLDSDASPTLDETIDPASSLSFPNTLKIQSKVPLPTLTLVGVGVRTVSFLGIQVYSVGFYADMNNPKLNQIPKSASPREKIEHIVQNSPCVLRIIPTRSTSFSHLRDGFIRAIQARMTLFRKNGALSKEEEFSIQAPLHKFKTMFPNTPLAKHAPLDILLTPPEPSQPRGLIIRDLGSVQHDWLAKEFFMAYFEGNGLSPAMQKSVFSRLQDFGQ
ncbi:hypothetical protein BDW22DRAFT_1392114 [Trametopsis cervina]|nr:hypothetical protein BDW22DRAFT_1392114 [Trametopsis cervina]